METIFPFRTFGTVCQAIRNNREKAQSAKNLSKVFSGWVSEIL